MPPDTTGERYPTSVLLLAFWFRCQHQVTISWNPRVEEAVLSPSYHYVCKSSYVGIHCSISSFMEVSEWSVDIGSAWHLLIRLDASNQDESLILMSVNWCLQQHQHTCAGYIGWLQQPLLNKLLMFENVFRYQVDCVWVWIPLRSPDWRSSLFLDPPTW